jgi:U3 small nucleolar RNA-associated protein 5
VKISRPDKSSTIVHVIDASFQEADMVMAWTEAGVNLVFERVRWKDESTGELLLKGVIEIVRGKSGSGLGATVMNGVKDLGRARSTNRRL